MKILSLFILALMIASLTGCGNEEENGGDEDYADSMAKEHAGDSPTGNDVAWLEPAGPVDTAKITYTYGRTGRGEGYLARPVGSDSAIPGLIVIHEWWGLNDNMRAMARRVAGEGYMALAVDLYENRVASTPDNAKVYMQEAMQNVPKGLNTIEGAISELKSRGATKIGVIGWCFGGGWALRTAVNFPQDIDAAVIYYGQLETDPAMLKKLDMPLLGVFGGKDQGIPVEQVKRFEAVLDSLGTDATIHIYPEANHAFANPSGERYDAEAAKDAWGKTTAFLAEHLK